MLTNAQYHALWTVFAPHINAAGALPPCYNDYVIRELMLEDYLDIFRGHDTRGHRGEPHGFIYDWDHPFDEILVNRPTPKIRYILIAEAANPGALTYFYDITHTHKTAYFNAPCRAFRVNPALPKVDKLIQLANEGVLLLDLFPFSLAYSPDLRNLINHAGLTLQYWNGTYPADILPVIPGAPECIQSRMNSIAALLDSKWDLALVAPCVISKYILSNPIIFTPIAVPPNQGVHPANFRNLLPNPKRCNHKGACNFKKIAVAQQTPSFNLIQIAFDL